MAGKHYDGLVSVCDVLPTCYALATEQDVTVSDGANIMPYLLGEKEELKDRIYYYAGAQRHWFGTKSKDKYPVKNMTEKVSVIQAFVFDEFKRIRIFLYSIVYNASPIKRNKPTICKKVL